MDIIKVNPIFHTHEGFTFLEWEGEFFKGCKRCGGEGHYQYNGEHSRCYACDNTSAKLGDQLPSRAAAEKWCHERAVRRAQRDRKREAERMKLVRAMEANQTALRQDDEEVYNFLMGIVIEDDTQEQFATYDEWAATQQGTTSKLEKDSFIRTMAETLRWVAPSKPFTFRMIAAVRRTMERRAAQAAEAASHPAPVGRVAVTGEIVSTKTKETDFGTQFKILVKDDAGFKVWASLPMAQVREASNDFYQEHTEPYAYGYSVWFEGSNNPEDGLTGVKGRRITFMATLEPSADDPSFAFGSRPSKGAWL